MSKHKKTHKKSAFLLKTYDILQNSEYENIVSWSPDGVGFIVHSTYLFAEKVLPIFFKHSNFHSFIRQLNMYGFSKKRTPKIENYYYNPKFCKGKSQLIGQIQRRVQKKNPKNSQNPIQSHPPTFKQSSHQDKNISEFSIQLQSKQQELNEDCSENDESYDKICIQFYTLMKVNNIMVNEQTSYLCEILRDIKSINSKSPEQEEKIKNIEEIFKDYILTHSKLREQLLSQSQKNIKNSQKYIKSLSALQTQSVLSGISHKLCQK